MCFWVTEKRVDHWWDVPIDLPGNLHILTEGEESKGLFSKSQKGTKLLKGKKKNPSSSLFILTLQD